MQSDWLVSVAGCMPYACSQHTQRVVCTNYINGDRIMVNVERMDCVSEGEPMLISATQAAKTLGISPRSLWTLTRAGTIPFIQLGRRVMYSPSSLQDWVARNTVVGGDKNGECI